MQHYENQSAICRGLGQPLELVNWQMPVAVNDVIIEVELTGVCASDVHIAEGEWRHDLLPVILGHEIVGRLVKIVPDLQDQCGSPLNLGDRVVIGSAYYGNCGACYCCIQLDAPWACISRMQATELINGEITNIYGGGLSRFVKVQISDIGTLLKVDTSAAAAVLHEPLSVAMAALREAGNMLCSEVVVQGTGTLGLLTIALARAAGATLIIAVGAPSSRLDVALSLGADYVVDINEIPDKEERGRLVRSYTSGGYGAEFCLDWTGAVEAFAEGLEFLRPGGTLMQAGTVSANRKVSIDPAYIWEKDLKIKALRGTGAANFERAINFLKKSEDILAPLITHSFSLFNVEQALRAVKIGAANDGLPLIKAVVDMR